MKIIFGNFRTISRYSVLLLCAWIVVGCETGRSGFNDAGLGKQISANGRWPVTGTAADALGKGILGTEFGKDLGDDALKIALVTEFEALEKGQTGVAVPWQRSRTITGKVTPQQVFEVGESKCRRYQHVITQLGKKRSAIGTACKGQNGVWVPLV